MILSDCSPWGQFLRCWNFQNRAATERHQVKAQKCRTFPAFTKQLPFLCKSNLSNVRSAQAPLDIRNLSEVRPVFVKSSSQSCQRCCPYFLSSWSQFIENMRNLMFCLKGLLWVSECQKNPKLTKLLSLTWDPLPQYTKNWLLTFVYSDTCISKLNFILCASLLDLQASPQLGPPDVTHPLRLLN